MRPPLFLVGAQRSGTTALAHAISGQVHAQHGGVFTVNGKLWYLLLRWLDVADLEARHFRADEVCYALRRRPAQGAGAAEWLSRADGALRVMAAEVASGVYPADPAGVRQACRAVAAAVAGAAPWGDKYNEYLLQLPELRATFPEARWLFLRRHPAEVVASMTEWTGVRPWNPASPRDCEAKWMSWNRRWLSFRSGLTPDRVLELDYADLCSGAANRAVQEFTELDLTAALRGYRNRRSPGLAASPEADRVWARLRDDGWRASGITPVPAPPGSPSEREASAGSR